MGPCPPTRTYRTQLVRRDRRGLDQRPSKRDVETARDERVGAPSSRCATGEVVSPSRVIGHLIGLGLPQSSALRPCPGGGNPHSWGPPTRRITGFRPGLPGIVLGRDVALVARLQPSSGARHRAHSRGAPRERCARLDRTRRSRWDSSPTTTCAICAITWRRRTRCPIEAGGNRLTAGGS